MGRRRSLCGREHGGHAVLPAAGPGPVGRRAGRPERPPRGPGWQGRWGREQPAAARIQRVQIRFLCPLTQFLAINGRGSDNDASENKSAGRLEAPQHPSRRKLSWRRCAPRFCSRPGRVNAPPSWPGNALQLLTPGPWAARASWAGRRLVAGGQREAGERRAGGNSSPMKSEKQDLDFHFWTRAHAAWKPRDRQAERRLAPEGREVASPEFLLRDRF